MIRLILTKVMPLALLVLIVSGKVTYAEQAGDLQQPVVPVVLQITENTIVLVPNIEYPKAKDIVIENRIPNVEVGASINDVLPATAEIKFEKRLEHKKPTITKVVLLEKISYQDIKPQ